ncbi:hypothetical protein ACIQUW_05130 [Streptomyces sp. NPDC101117]|uniref:hypothetical protein n=1 Tax=Streptomyces sp. NPDC101117 TaxID=3366108 RepID=UPI00381E5962
MSQNTTSPQPAGSEGSDAAGGGVTIGSMTGGSIATGREGRAVSYNTTGGAPLDTAHQELLTAVRELLAELPEGAGRGADDAALHDELVGLQEELTRSGTAEQGRLTRVLGGVRRWLGSQAAAAGAVASATAVVQGIAQLLG